VRRPARHVSPSAPSLRIATFALENFDETAPGEHLSLDDRIALMKAQIMRLRADIACFQEVHGQECPQAENR
jgi:hypothetical protein